MREKNNHQESLINKYYILICVIALFYESGKRLMDASLASYANVMWSSKSLGGYLTSAFTVGSIMMAFISGPIVNRVGRRKSLFWGSLAFAVPTLLCPFFSSKGFILFTRFIQGTAKSITIIAASAAIADVTPKSRMNEGMGLFNYGTTFAVAMGPVLALLIMRTGQYNALFTVSGSLYICVVLLCVGLNYEKKQPLELSNNRPEKTGYRGIWRFLEKHAIPAALNYTISFSAIAGILVFLTVYSQEQLHLSELQIMLFYIVATIFMVLVRIVFSKTADRKGPLVILIPGNICLLASLFVLAFLADGSYLAYLLAAALYGVAYGIIMTALLSQAVKESPPERNSIASATFFFFADIGIMFFSAIYGKIIDFASDTSIGYRNMFLCAMAIGICSLVFATCMFNQKTIQKRLEGKQ